MGPDRLGEGSRVPFSLRIESEVIPQRKLLNPLAGVDREKPLVGPRWLADAGFGAAPTGRNTPLLSISA